MADTPGRGLPVFDEATIVRWRLGYLTAFIAGLLGACIFCTTMWSKVDRLAEDVNEIRLWIRTQKGTP